MTCSPCYIARADDCPRNLACLRQLNPAVVYETARRLLGHPVGLHDMRKVEEAGWTPTKTETEAAFFEDAVRDSKSLAARPITSEDVSSGPASVKPRRNAKTTSGKRRSKLGR